MRPDENLDPERLARILGPGAPELTCDECFEHLDRFVEIELAAGLPRAQSAIPGLEAHLAGCPACREDHDSLLALLLEHGT